MRKAEVNPVHLNEGPQETRVEDQVESLLKKIQPTRLADQRRSAVFDYVRAVVKKHLPACEVFSVGSFPLKTYLPCADVDMVMFVPQNTDSQDSSIGDNPLEDWAQKRNCDSELGLNEINARRSKESEVSGTSSTPPLVAVNQALCMVATKRVAKRGADLHTRYTGNSEQRAKPEIRNVSFINARTPMVTMLVGNIVVDLTENQAGSVAASVLLEEADRFIQRNNLFKRSLLLLKAWALCETPRLVGQRVLGAREGGLTSYGLSIMVLHLFGSRQSADTLLHPLDVFIRFFEVFAEFDWSRHCLTLDGPVAFEEVRDNRLGGYRSKCTSTSQLWPIVDRVLSHLSPPGEKADITRLRRVSRSGRRSDGQDGSSRGSVTAGPGDLSTAHFPVRYCNIQDPLNALNNLGHSVSRRSLKALEYALQQGRQLLKECELLSPADVHRKVLVPGDMRVRANLEENPVATYPAVGGHEFPSGERDMDQTVRLDPPRQTAPVVAPVNPSSVFPRQVLAPMPLLRFPPIQPMHTGVYLGSAPAVPMSSVHHLAANGAQQFRLAHPQSVVHLPFPMYQFVYHPYLIPESRTATGATSVIAGQVRHHGPTFVPATALHGQLQRGALRGIWREPLSGLESQSVGAADMFRQDPPSQHVHLPADGAIDRATRAHPTSWSGSMNGCSSNGREQVSFADERERGASEKEVRGAERKHLEDECGRYHTAKPAMLPWNLPAFSTSPTSSTASMSEYAEDAGKEDQDRQLLHESGDGDVQRAAESALQHSSWWPRKEEVITPPADDSQNADVVLDRRHQTGRGGKSGGGSKRPRRALDTGGRFDGTGANGGLWIHWFLRDFFPHCCQLYGSGDGFREDLLDHPCQHWSSLQRPAVASPEGSADVLLGASSEMWSALETVGQVIRGKLKQPSGENKDGQTLTNGRRTENPDVGELRSGLVGKCAPQRPGCRGAPANVFSEQIKQSERVKGHDSLNAPKEARICDIRAEDDPPGPKDGHGDVGLQHKAQMLNVNSPAVEASADDETGSTTSEEQGEKRDKCSATSGSKAPLRLPSTTIPSTRCTCKTNSWSVVSQVQVARPPSVVASTQTDDNRGARRLGLDVGVQCSPARAVLISCGTQCGSSGAKTLSTGAQVASRGVRPNLVSRGMQCFPERVETMSTGTQCLLPTSQPKTADIGVATDPLAGTRKERPKHSLAQPSSASDEHNRDIDCSSAISSVSREDVDDLAVVHPKNLLATAGFSEVQTGHAVTSKVIPGVKKHKRKKNRPIGRCLPTTSVASSGRATGRDVLDASQCMGGAMLQRDEGTEPKASRGLASWKVLSPGGSMRRKRVRVVVTVCVALSMVFAGLLSLGSEARNAMKSGPPFEVSRPREGVKERTYPPMWVMIGGSLTLGDVILGRAEDGEGFQWFKDGEILPGRTSSFLSIMSATLEDEGIYTCYSARAKGAARHIPLWEETSVRVSEPPSVESQLQTQRLARGEMLAIVATASGVPQPQYQWRRNGVPIPGATRPMLVRHSVSEADMGIYTCDVYNVAGSVQWEEMAVILREDIGTRDARSGRRYPLA